MRETKNQLIAIGAIALSSVLAGCSGSPSPDSLTGPTTATISPTKSSEPTVTASEVPTDTDPSEGYVDMGYGHSGPSGGPGDCESAAYIFIGMLDDQSIAEVLLPENLVDMGPREFAQGEVGYDATGRVSTYTVAPGDVSSAIGSRLCIVNGLGLEDLNGYGAGRSIHPGDVLVIDPETVPGWEYSPG